jgi:hypothetical protein
MNFLNDYFELIIIGICLCIGYIVKNVIPSKSINRFIPLIMGVVGVALALWLHSFSLSPEILLSGLVSGLASTGMFEMFRQFIEKGE